MDKELEEALDLIQQSWWRIDPGYEDFKNPISDRMRQFLLKHQREPAPMKDPRLSKRQKERFLR